MQKHWFKMDCIKMIDMHFIRGFKIQMLSQKILGPNCYHCSNYANAIKGFYWNWNEYSEEKKTDVFKAKLKELKTQICHILIKDIKLPKKIVDGIKIVPAGLSRNT